LLTSHHLCFCFSYCNSIAFKPAESGWGGNSKYSQNFDNIFGGKKTTKNPGEKTTKTETATATSSSSSSE
jgi:uncharacterized FlgJ-related protein